MCYVLARRSPLCGVFCCIVPAFALIGTRGCISFAAGPAAEWLTDRFEEMPYDRAKSARETVH